MNPIEVVRRWIGRASVPLLGYGLIAMSAQPIAAQGGTTGTVTGTVIEASTQAPMGSVQVLLEGTGLGTLTTANGRFILLNVPAGTHQVQVRRIGYKTGRQPVTVQAGQAASVSIALETEVLNLDEVIVTGTAGQARRREVGNSISQVNAAEVEEPVASVDQMLQARVPGMQVMNSSASSGSGGDIRLRGNVSVSMSPRPLIYIDGVRMNSESYRGVRGGGADHRQALNDINPNDIERIEVIKGPAATTLYGTEAAAGVIQIFTKTGSSGSPQWTAQIDQGIARGRPYGTPDNPYFNVKPFLKDGHRQRYGLSVRGGTQDLGYYLSFNRDDNDGIVANDWEKSWSVRGNTTFRPSTNTLIQWNSSFMSSDVSNMAHGNSTTSLMMNAWRGKFGYWGLDPTKPETFDPLFERDIFQFVTRGVTGVTAQYTPTQNFSNKFTLGLDNSTWAGDRVVPYDWAFTPKDGERNRDEQKNRVLSVEYVGSYALDFGDQFRTTLSFGGQGIESQGHTLLATGRGFPGPGDFTVTGTERRDATEEKIRVITGGFFGQSLFAMKDRYFLTLGLRVDGNSAFGQDFGLQPYPKVSGSYVLSDEPFWNQGWGTVKLRGAYGFAGRAPGAFDAVRTWATAKWVNETTALEPSNRGNPTLGPERTGEIELGFDGAFLNNRVAVDYTYYNRTTKDALFFMRSPPTIGGWSSQLENVGELNNRGHEIMVNTALLETAAFRWDVGVSLATNASEVISLGGAPQFSVGDKTWIVEGQPIPVIRGHKITNWNEVADPIIERDHFFGPAYPTKIWNFTTSVGLPYGVEVSGRGELQTGAYVYEFPTAMALTRGLPWPYCQNARAARDAKNTSSLQAWERSWCLNAFHTDLMIRPADFFEVRDLTLTMPVDRFTPGTQSARFTLSARNVWGWKDMPLFHPEQREQNLSSGTRFNARIGETLPPPSLLMASLRVTF